MLLSTAGVMAACGSGGSGGPTTGPASATTHTTGAAATTAATSAPTTAPATTPAGGGGVPTSCPPASVVNAALGQSVGAPVLAQQPFGISCTYSGGGPVPTKITFQQDTPATFAAGENAVPSVAKVSGLGDAAYATTGFLAVLNGTYSIRILSPLSSQQQLEALGRQLLD